jgi:hypothetical protein
LPESGARVHFEWLLLRERSVRLTQLSISCTDLIGQLGAQESVLRFVKDSNPPRALAWGFVLRRRTQPLETKCRDEEAMDILGCWNIL